MYDGDPPLSHSLPSDFERFYIKVEEEIWPATEHRKSVVHLYLHKIWSPGLQSSVPPLGCVLPVSGFISNSWSSYREERLWGWCLDQWAVVHGLSRAGWSSWQRLLWASTLSEGQNESSSEGKWCGGIQKGSHLWDDFETSLKRPRSTGLCCLLF